MLGGQNYQSLVKFLLAVFVVVMLFWYLYPGCNEQFGVKFDGGIKTVESNPLEYKQPDIPLIQAPQYSAYDETIQSGSLFIPQNEFYSPWGNIVKLDESDSGKTGFKDSIDIGDNGLNFNQCSPACCSDQWPLPFKLPVDKMTCGSKDEFVPTSYFCNNGWQDSGCLCMRKDQSEFIGARGQNTDF